MIVNGIFLIIYTLYICLYVAAFVGACALRSVPMRMANFDLPVDSSYFLTGPLSFGMDCVKFITATEKLTKQVSYTSQFETIISIYEGQHAVSQI